MDKSWLFQNPMAQQAWSGVPCPIYSGDTTLNFTNNTPLIVPPQPQSYLASISMPMLTVIQQPIPTLPDTISLTPYTIPATTMPAITIPAITIPATTMPATIMSATTTPAEIENSVKKYGKYMYTRSTRKCKNRAPNPFMLYRLEHIKAYKGRNMSSSDINRELSNGWRNLSPENKNEYTVASRNLQIYMDQNKKDKPTENKKRRQPKAAPKAPSDNASLNSVIEIPQQFEQTLIVCGDSLPPDEVPVFYIFSEENNVKSL